MMRWKTQGAFNELGAAKHFIMPEDTFNELIQAFTNYEALLYLYIQQQLPVLVSDMDTVKLKHLVKLHSSTNGSDGLYMLATLDSKNGELRVVPRLLAMSNESEKERVTMASVKKHLIEVYPVLLKQYKEFS